MKKNITYNDITSEYSPRGLVLYALVNGYLIHRIYCGYTKKAACKLFYDYCNSL